ncbi:DUF742 domain-containing protein [Streptomyces daliensis]
MKGPWTHQDSVELRAYALTQGRTEAVHPLRPETLLSAAHTPPARARSARPRSPESARAVRMCAQQPCSVAEIAARLGRPLLVTKVVLSDLLEDRLLTVTAPPAVDAKDPQTLEAVLAGLRQRFIA